MIAVLSVHSEVKLLVAFTSLLLYLSLPLVGCHSLTITLSAYVEDIRPY